MRHDAILDSAGYFVGRLGGENIKKDPVVTLAVDLIRDLAKALRAEVAERDELSDIARSEMTECERVRKQMDEARAERDEASERLAHCENVLREAANCIAPPDLFGERGLEEDDAEYHIEAQRSVDAYFEKYPDAKGDKP